MHMAGTIFFVLTLCFSVFSQGKDPMILIPGLSGSELVHKKTLKKVWFRIFKSKYEDLRLPIAADPTRMHDDLIPGDILRKPKLGIIPVTDVYEGFIKAMETRRRVPRRKVGQPVRKRSTRRSLRLSV